MQENTVLWRPSGGGVMSEPHHSARLRESCDFTVGLACDFHENGKAIKVKLGEFVDLVVRLAIQSTEPATVHAELFPNLRPATGAVSEAWLVHKRNAHGLLRAQNTSFAQATGLAYSLAVF
jgi:hypothetical protein